MQVWKLLIIMVSLIKISLSISKGFLMMIIQMEFQVKDMLSQPWKQLFTVWKIPQTTGMQF